MVYLVIVGALYFLDMMFPHTQSLAYKHVITMVKEYMTKLFVTWLHFWALKQSSCENMWLLTVHSL